MQFISEPVIGYIFTDNQHFSELNQYYETVSNYKWDFCFDVMYDPEVVKKSQKISEDLIAAFNHEDIQTSVHWGTKEQDNLVSIAFCKYEMAGKCYNDLENLATRVKTRVLNQHPDLIQMYLIEVKFTREENDEVLQNIVTFQFLN